MTKETYLKLTGYIRDNPRRIQVTDNANRILTGFVFLIYPLFLLLLFLQGNPFLLRAALVPSISFAAVSVFRNVFHAQRPYEKFGIPPVLQKDTRGKSFPSRHVFSAFVIAVTVYRLYPIAGAILAGIGVVLGVIRVIGGVHEPKDVVAGALTGILSGVLGYYFI